MPKVFICYRRDDTSGYAGWLRERLNAELGSFNVFIDVGSIDYGEDFQRKLQALLHRVDVVLALVGPRWATAKNEDGNLRLHVSSDEVRREITEALKREILIIPTLVAGAKMPTPQQLPDELHAFAVLQAVTLSDSTFQADVKRLADVVRARSFDLPPAASDLTISLAYLRQLLRQAPPEARRDLIDHYLYQKLRLFGTVVGISALSGFFILAEVAQRVDLHLRTGWDKLIALSLTTAAVIVIISGGILLFKRRKKRRDRSAASVESTGRPSRPPDRK